eukprot:g1109.t1
MPLRMRVMSKILKVRNREQNKDGKKEETRSRRKISVLRPASIVDPPQFVQAGKGQAELLAKVLRSQSKFTSFGSFTIRDAFLKQERSSEDDVLLATMVLESMSRSNLLQGLKSFHGSKIVTDRYNGDPKLWFTDVHETAFMSIDWAKRLIQRAEMSLYKGGNVVYRQGEDAENVYILVNGHVCCTQTWAGSRPPLKKRFDLRAPGPQKNVCVLLSDRALLGLDFSGQRDITEISDEDVAEHGHRCTKEAIGGCFECRKSTGLWNSVSKTIYPTASCPWCFKATPISLRDNNKDDDDSGEESKDEEEDNDDIDNDEHSSDTAKLHDDDASASRRTIVCSNPRCHRSFQVAIPSKPDHELASALTLPRSRTEELQVGNVDDRFYIVLDGCVEILMQTDNQSIEGRRGLPIARYTAGMSFGENSLLSAQFERPYSARTYNGSAVLACVSGEKYRLVLRSFRAMAIARRLGLSRLDVAKFQGSKDDLCDHDKVIKDLTLAMGASEMKAKRFLRNDRDAMERAIGDFLYDAISKSWPRSYASGIHERTAGFFTRRVCYTLVREKKITLMKARAGSTACAMYSGRGTKMYVLLDGLCHLTLMLKGRTTPLVIATPIGSAIGHSTLLDQMNADHICSLREIKGETIVKSALSRKERMLLETKLKTKKEIDDEQQEKMRRKGLLSSVDAIDDSVFFCFKRSDYKHAVHKERSELLARQETLRDFAFFEGASEMEIALIAQHVDARQFARGESVIVRGKVRQGLHIIIKGELRIVDDDRGNDQDAALIVNKIHGRRDVVRMNAGLHETTGLLETLATSTIYGLDTLFTNAKSGRVEVYANTIVAAVTPTIVWSIDSRFLDKMSESLLKTFRRRARMMLRSNARRPEILRPLNARAICDIDGDDNNGSNTKSNSISRKVVHISKDGQYSLAFCDERRRGEEEWLVRSYRVNEFERSSTRHNMKQVRLMNGWEKHIQLKRLRSVAREKKQIEDHFLRREAEQRRVGTTNAKRVIASRLARDGTTRAARALTRRNARRVEAMTASSIARLGVEGNSSEQVRAAAATFPSQSIARREARNRRTAVARITLESMDAWDRQLARTHRELGSFWSPKRSSSIRADDLLRGQFSDASKDSYASVRDRYLESPYDAARVVPTASFASSSGVVERVANDESSALGSAATINVQNLADTLEGICRNEDAVLRNICKRPTRTKGGISFETFCSTRRSAIERRGVFFPSKPIRARGLVRGQKFKGQ